MTGLFVAAEFVTGMVVGVVGVAIVLIVARGAQPQSTRTGSRYTN